MITEKYREKPAEQQRIAQALGMIPPGRVSVLDVGARDGYISALLAPLFEQVTALDLERPPFVHDRVTSVQGDVTCLQFPDGHFDSVVCLEVLEHIPPRLLQRACDEITRVARHDVVIGVPFKQDIRVGRTTCYSCGRKNPPWGHVNSFDEDRLRKLFPRLNPTELGLVGENRSRTNALSVLLMDLAGNPYGTYLQQERCVFCAAKLKPPPERTPLQKVLTRLALFIQRSQLVFMKPHPNWVHLLFAKNQSSTA